MTEIPPRRTRRTRLALTALAALAALPGLAACGNPPADLTPDTPATPPADAPAGPTAAATPTVSVAIDLAQDLGLPPDGTASATIVTVTDGVLVALVRMMFSGGILDEIRGVDLATGTALWTSQYELEGSNYLQLSALASGGRIAQMLIRSNLTDGTETLSVGLAVIDAATGATVAYRDLGQTQWGQVGPRLIAYTDGVVHIGLNSVGWMALADTDLTTLWAAGMDDFTYPGDPVLGPWVHPDSYRDAATGVPAPLDTRTRRAYYTTVGGSVIQVNSDPETMPVTALDLTPVDPATGTPEWPAPAALTAGRATPYLCATAESPLVVVDGTRVRALSRADGTELWAWDKAESLTWDGGCAIVAGRYAAIGRGQDTADNPNGLSLSADLLDLADGHLVVTLTDLVQDTVNSTDTTTGIAVLSWLLSDGATVFAHTTDGRFTAYDGAGDWRELWSLSLPKLATVAYQDGATFYFLDGATAFTVTT
jgi:hypothetical protein